MPKRDNRNTNPLRPHSSSEDLPFPVDPIVTDKLVQYARMVCNNLYGDNRLLASLILYTGCRPVEALSIRNCDVDSSGLIRLRARKGSASRIVFYPGILPHVTRSPEHSARPVLWRTDYWRFYRAVKNLVQGRAPRSKERQKIGNLFRCAAARFSQTFTHGDLSIASEFLGRRSSRSTTHYTHSGGLTHG